MHEFETLDLGLHLNTSFCNLSVIINSQLYKVLPKIKVYNMFSSYVIFVYYISYDLYSNA